MTNDAPTAVESPRPPDAAQWYEQTAAILLGLGCVLGVLRAAGIVASGSGGFVPWIEAAYAALLHAAAGCVAFVLVRGLGAWLGLAAARGATPTPVVAAASVPPAVDEPAAEPPPIDASRWRERLEAAREANDPARVLELREDAPAGQDEAALKELDADLGKWFLGLVHRRLRSGPLQLDLVTLVDRVSEVLGHTKDGASLRAALPTLRRGAGLCPRCAKPYAGVWEACPECMGRPEPPPPVIPGLAMVQVEVEEVELEVEAPPGERWFLDPDEEPPCVDGRPGL